MANYRQLSLTSQDGTPLFGREWQPEAGTKGWVTLCHGTSEHSGRYKELAQHLNDAGFGLVMADLRGSGRSEGRRGHIDHFDQYSQDLAAAIEHTRQHSPDKHILGGHSLGGLIAADLSIHHSTDMEGISAIFLSGPAFGLAFKPPTWKIWLSNRLSSLAPGLQLSSGLNLQHLTHDQSIVEQQRTDPYNHGKVTPKMFTEYLRVQQQVLADAASLTLPLLLMHGGSDPINSLSGSEQFYNSAGSIDKHLKVYESFYHEIFNEIGRDQVFTDLIHWIEQV